MSKAILYVLLFIILGLAVSSLVSPLVAHGADQRGIGRALAPFIILTFGIIGFVFGWRRRNRPQ